MWYLNKTHILSEQDSLLFGACFFLHFLKLSAGKGFIYVLEMLIVHQIRHFP